MFHEMRATMQATTIGEVKQPVLFVAFKATNLFYPHEALSMLLHKPIIRS